MRQRWAVVATVAVIMVAGVAITAGADQSKLLDTNSMVGVPRPYTGATNAVRGVPGGGLPWIVDFGRVKISPHGDVDVQVRGLVFDPADQAVMDAGLAGINTIPNFRAIVSCLSKDSDGNSMVVNVQTGLYPADDAGNAHIKEQVAIPEPCIAPIVFVTSPGGAWFAATGS